MKINNRIKRVLCSVIIFVLIMPNFSFAKGSITKEETVYVNLDTEGIPIDKTSSIWLHSDSPLNKVEDRTILKEIVNVKGDEEPEVRGDKIIWKTDKKDIFYQGKIDKSLPIAIDIKYYLNNKEMKPEDIVGKSGSIRIKIKLDNKDTHIITKKNGSKKEVYTPLIATTVVNLPLDKFTDVNVNSGKILSDGNNQIITFATIPGLRKSLNLDKDILELPEYLEITATTDDFEMKPIVVTITSDLPEIKDIEGAEDLEELIDGIDKIKESSEKLSEGTGLLAEGQTKLNNGIDEFVNGIDQLNGGADGLNRGVGELKKGIDSAYNGSSDINKGAKELEKGGKALGNGTEEWSKGAMEFSKGSKEFVNGVEKLSEDLSKVPENTKKMNKGMNNLVDGTGQVIEGQDNLTNGLEESLKGLEKIKKGKEQELEIINLLLGGNEKLIDAAEKIANAPVVGEIGEGILQGLNKQNEGLLGLQYSSKEIITGIEQLETGLNQAKEGSEKLSENLATINSGQEEIGFGLDQLAAGTEALGEVSKEFEKGSMALEDGANELNKNANKLNKGAKEFNQGAGALFKGTNKLSSGLNELSKGAGQLKEGTNELTNGTNQLTNGSNKLKDGANELGKGTKELDKGMKKFHEEGILEISNRIEDSDLDIDEILRIKDELVKISKEYDSFSGKDKEMDGSVKFVMKTEGIDKVEEAKEIDVPEEKQREKSFIQWLKDKFKRKK